MSYCRPPIFSLRDQARLQTSLNTSESGSGLQSSESSRGSFQSFMASTHASLKGTSRYSVSESTAAGRHTQASPFSASQEPSPSSPTSIPGTPELLDTENSDPKAIPTSDAPRLGSLASRFESGHAIDAIGYDPRGGTSYGMYQISSRTGSMERFLDFLDNSASDIVSRLRDSGPANTGSRNGAMPEVWKSIAAEDPERFQALQHEFIADTHYRPLVQAVKRSTGLDLDTASQAVREVAWSTAIQHGPENGAAIMSKAVTSARRMPETDFESTLIADTYAERATRFSSSPLPIQQAVRSRFESEQSLALAMLDKQPTRA